MEIQPSLIVTLMGLAISVIGAAAVAKHELKTIHEGIAEIFRALKKIDQRTDKHDIKLELFTNKTQVLASMMSPEVMERRHRENEAIKKDVEFLKERIK